MSHDDTRTTPDRLAVDAVEAARLIGISQRKIWTMTKARTIPHVRIGGRVIYPISSLTAWLQDQVDLNLEKSNARAET